MDRLYDCMSLMSEGTAPECSDLDHLQTAYKKCSIYDKTNQPIDVYSGVINLMMNANVDERSLRRLCLVDTTYFLQGKSRGKEL